MSDPRRRAASDSPAEVPPAEGEQAGVPRPPAMAIFGVDVLDVSRGDAIVFLQRRLSSATFTPIHFLNAHSANLAVETPFLAERLRSFVVLADGVGVDMAAWKLHGRHFPDNLNGTDFVPDLLAAVDRPLRIGLIGASRKSLDGAVERLRRDFPLHQFEAVASGYHDIAMERQILSRLEAARPDILLVALGVPKQEFWIAEKLDRRHCTLAIGVGALFDFLSGAVLRAPAPIRAARLEWAWRLIWEPRRLFHRYVVGNPLFLWRLHREAKKG